MEVSKQAFLRAWENQKLVRGALKAAHVRTDYNYYEDLLQEGILVYAQMLTRNAELPRVTVDQLSFRKIIWHTVDLLRKQKRVSDVEIDIVKAAQVGQVHKWNNYLALEKELAQMSQLEQLIFFNHLIGKETISALSRKNGINRIRLQRTKSNLLARLQAVLEN